MKKYLLLITYLLGLSLNAQTIDVEKENNTYTKYNIEASDLSGVVVTLKARITSEAQECLGPAAFYGDSYLLDAADYKEYGLYSKYMIDMDITFANAIWCNPESLVAQDYTLEKRALFIKANDSKKLSSTIFVKDTFEVSVEEEK